MDFTYKKCTQCPRECGANRTSSFGFCGESEQIRIASACLHFGEEPPITVFGGSGTIFLTGCNLRCAFCQNYQISQQGMGAYISFDDFAEICIRLQEKGAENINIVTASHAVPALAKALETAKTKGLEIPVCWNSSAYEKVQVLELLDGLVDIWLPDFKSINSDLSGKVFKAKDYPEHAKEAILYMTKKSPLVLKNVRNPNNPTETREKMLSGVIVRHLFLPGHMEDTILALDWLKKNVDGKAFVSLMSQYTPVPFKGDNDAEATQRKNALSAMENRLVSKGEFQEIQDILAAYDFENLFYQELEQDTSWLPDFAKTQPFSNELAKPIWHWKKCFI